MKAVRLMALVALMPATAFAQDKPATPPAAAPVVIDASGLKPMTLVYTVTRQGALVGETTRTITREMKGTKDLVKVHSAATGPQTVTSDLVFEAKAFKPISASMSMSAGGQDMSAVLSVDGGRAAGMLKLPTSTEPQMVDVDFPDGTLLPGMEEFAVGLADLALNKEVTVNTLNPQNGTVTSATLVVTGESKQKVAAGEFDVWEMELKGRQGGPKRYVRKDGPHILVKQTNAQAQASIELKEIK